ncbi:ABA4-like family protein [Aquimarina brevivitae]|uniref:Uncharacterized protein DUF4281 n=1 Tax=Aquimarina brevivitae TaxID=323412 RepID=A0A4Q7P0P4_9FLAO|nr:ABA4-like family protein [Aquimarina brevivitae]RZS93373.1 uncharacterized protein DUF4281 [Aquimarina brevivitae]
MTPSDIFSLTNTVALLMWLLMIIVPNWRVTRFLIDYKVIPILLSLVYAVFIFQAFQTGGNMDFGSLEAVMALFTEENAVLAGWVHYLAFDLIVGMWILDQNKTLKAHQLIIAPCLLATFMFGPLGFLLFMIIKGVKKRRS